MRLFISVSLAAEMCQSRKERIIALMPPLQLTLRARLLELRDTVAVVLGRARIGPLLIDRGNGLLYDVERDITWLQDANYARTVGRSPDGQLRWHDARAWVAGLSYRGVRGWRLPDARRADGSGPREGPGNAEGEIGHLFIVAAKQMSPPDLQLTNFEPFSIYWYRNEASDSEAFAFRMLELRQGRLAKDPWGQIFVPLVDKVLAWPVHEGDVSSRLFARFMTGVRILLSAVRQTRSSTAR
jgi:hypothetical protein